MDRPQFMNAQTRYLGPLVRGLTRLHAALYARTGGRLGRQYFGRDVLILTTTGARTGRLRSIPLVYMPDGDRWIVLPTNSGIDRAPAWWLNLQASPEAVVQVGGQRYDVEARALDAIERAEMWPRAAKFHPDWQRCQEMTARMIPIVALERSAG